MKNIIIVCVFFTSFSVFAADDSARQECIKDCQQAKNSDLSYCEKNTGSERSECRDKAQEDYLQCSTRCDSKYGR